MEKLILKSPAKINIGLNVVCKREDGFHDIETIFYPLQLSDVLEFEKSNEDFFKSSNTSLNDDPTNLILRAKNRLKEISGKNLNCHIRIQKNIPMGAGLGGGSSNAATTLIALNSLFELDLAPILPKLALELGSDVPFFLNPVPSFAKSRGEILGPIQLEIDAYILLVNPGIHISTKWAFDGINDYKSSNLKNYLNNDNLLNNNKLSNNIKNDFEAIVFSKYPNIAKIKNTMIENGSYFSRMTGTGSTVFGFFKDINAALNLKEHYTNLDYFTYLEHVPAI